MAIAKHVPVCPLFHKWFRTGCHTVSAPSFFRLPNLFPSGWPPQAGKVFRFFSHKLRKDWKRYIPSWPDSLPECFPAWTVRQNEWQSEKYSPSRFWPLSPAILHWPPHPFRRAALFQFPEKLPPHVHAAPWPSSVYEETSRRAYRSKDTGRLRKFPWFFRPQASVRLYKEPAGPHTGQAARMKTSLPASPRARLLFLPPVSDCVFYWAETACQSRFLRSSSGKKSQKPDAWTGFPSFCPHTCPHHTSFSDKKTFSAATCEAEAEREISVSLFFLSLLHLSYHASHFHRKQPHKKTPVPVWLSYRKQTFYFFVPSKDILLFFRENSYDFLKRWRAGSR